VVFSSNVFLFCFLPVVLTLNYLLPRRLRNSFLFLVSVFFYLWGIGPVILAFLAMIVVNYVGGALIDRSPGGRATLYVALMVAVDCAFLAYYKYLNFFGDQLSLFCALFGVHWQRTYNILLPIGVSFFTFQVIAYVVEIYRRQQVPAKHIVDLGMYLALFPHVVAGPIVRYSDISQEVDHRRTSLNDLFYGLQRFSIGLAKKVLIANQIGVIADRAFNQAPASLTMSLAWLGAASYGLQIYFDFSGYSDMAIGLARLLGFHFPENFNQPYRATSITDFWRRWHMTLSRWFRDFVYISLGGNRKGAVRTYANLFVVFVLCGLWHGAAWHFVVWGMFHGGLLVIERVLKTRFGFVPRGPLGNVASLLLVFVGWVLFRAADMDAALAYLRTMFGLSPSPTVFIEPMSFYVNRRFLFFFACAAVISVLPFERLRQVAIWKRPVGLAAIGFGSLALLFYSAAVLSTVGFNPFIYFQF